MWTCRAARRFTTAVATSRKYVVEGNETHVLKVRLGEGETMMADPGSLVMMDSSVQMSSEAKGGLFQSMGRMLSGAGLLMTTFKNAGQGMAELIVGPDFYSKILPYTITPDQPVICQRNTFLCSDPSVEIAAHRVSAFAGLLGGGGLVHQKLTGSGVAFLKVSGAILDVQLQPGEKWFAHPGSWVCYEPTVTFEIKYISGAKNILFGQGLSLVCLTGPGRVVLETMPSDRIVAAVHAKRPKKHKSSGSGSDSSVAGADGGASVLGTLAAAALSTGLGKGEAGQAIPAGEDEQGKEDSEHDNDFMSGEGGDSGGADDVGPGDD